MKIQYVDKRPNYSKAVVSVHDHVECRCQPAPRPPAAPKKKSTPRRQQKDNKGEGRPAKARSKEELHRRDELKHNQRIQLEDLLDQHWNPKDTSSDAGEGKGGYGLDHDKMDPQWVLNATSQLGAKEWTEHRHHDDMEEGRDSSSVNGTTTAMDIDMAQLDHEKSDGIEIRGDTLFNITEGNVSRGDRQQGSLSLSEEGDQETQRQPTQTQSPSLRTNTSKQQQHGTNSSSEETKSREGANQRMEQRFHPTEEINQRPESRFPPLEEAGQRRKDNETPDSERRLQHALQLEQEKLEEERKELLLLHRRLDDEKEHLRREQQKQQQEEEEQQYHRPNHKHQTQTTTQRTGR